jgi:cytoskeletal protein CcmA (bactofilin family)
MNDDFVADTQTAPTGQSLVLAAGNQPNIAGSALVAKADPGSRQVSAPVALSSDEIVAAFDPEKRFYVPRGVILNVTGEVEQAHIEGEIRGELRVSKGPCFIAPGARVVGSITAVGDVLQGGEIRGQDDAPALKVDGRWTLLPSAAIEGDAYYKSIRIFDGDGQTARIKGRIQPAD